VLEQVLENGPPGYLSLKAIGALAETISDRHQSAGLLNMKIFIVADIEGAVGVSKRSQCYFMKPDFQYGRRCLTDDVNAVVKGAIEAGADSIVVRDTHETGRNIIREDLHPGVEYIGDQLARPFPILGDPSGADLVFLVASHARSGSPGGFFAHTFFGGFSEVRINGKPVGEAFIYAATLSEWGIPIAFNSGDKHAIRESLSIMPWLETVEAPKEEGYYSVPEAGERIRVLRERLRASAFEAVKGKGEMKCLELQRDSFWEVDIKNSDLAEKIIVAGASLIGGTLSWQAGTYLEGFDTFFSLVQAAFLAYSS
jgi:D-amino peptidase